MAYYLLNIKLNINVLTNIKLYTFYFLHLNTGPHQCDIDRKGHL